MKPVSEKVFAVNENEGVISYLKDLARGSGMVHPDVSGRLRELKEEVNDLILRRCLRSEVLLDVNTQRILVVAFGTGYALRVDQQLTNALTEEKKQKIDWSDGTSLNLEKQFGEGWICGSYDKAEVIWLSDTLKAQPGESGNG
jgi:hypothetical protein